MINSIRIQNLRILKDTQDIEIKPITVLVGKNSSGKSTFARSFPLLKQSIENRTRGPMLWYDENLVDYGSFSEAVRHNEEEIIFTFKINSSDISSSIRERWGYESEFLLYHDDHIFYSECEITVSIVLAEISSGKETFSKKITLFFLGNKCEINFQDVSSIKDIIINDSIFKIPEDQRLIAMPGDFINNIRLLVKRRRKLDDGKERQIWTTMPHFSLSTLKKEIEKHVTKRTSPETIFNISKELKLGTDKEMLEILPNIGSATIKWQKSIGKLTNNCDDFIQLKKALIWDQLSNILSQADRNISKFFKGIRYVAPLRATAQRYYRRQELSVREIDRTGGNVAMFLDSLSLTEKDRFNSWMKEHLGVIISTKRSGGHVALELNNPYDGIATNLADIGFGYSQILPIAVQVWSATSNVSHGRTRSAAGGATCLVIEQPELHLHPEYQSRIADVLSIFAHKNNNTSVIAETHSQHLVNRLGQLIMMGKINRDDVQVILFDDSLKENVSIVRAHFDDNGVLQNWPFGFFEPDYSF